ncbi:MAG: ATPase, T2SS/T4P/T4SS family [bacterium]
MSAHKDETQVPGPARGPKPASGPGAKRLGEVLRAAGWVSAENLKEALEQQRREGGRLGRILVEKGRVAERTLLEALAQQSGMGIVDLAGLEADPDAISSLPYGMAKRYRCLPWRREDRLLHVAMAEPQDPERVQAVQFACGMRLKTYLCSEREIDVAIEQHYGMEDAVDQIVRNIADEARLADAATGVLVETDAPRAGDAPGPEPARSGDERAAPIVRLVNLIVVEAVRKEASDIHFEPAQRHLRVRFRLDGVLHKRMQIPKYLQQAVLSRLKVMARMDIANKRTPQDGGIRLSVEGRRLDLRVSSLPTFYGEKIVVRILDQAERRADLGALGLCEEDRQRLVACYRKPQGMILLTGPTGSGKSTTIQCILKDLRCDGINIITVEDPIEYELEGINQVQVHKEAGLTFADSLRAILRQDPNVIMVGEIRDSETAEVAFRAAMTGHLVLSTLHTNDAASTVVRLVDIGVPRFLIASALLAVSSQRLVRRICPECKAEDSIDPSLLAEVPLAPAETALLRRGRGCPSCEYTGHRGRIGLYELMTVTPEMREAISRGAGETEIRDLAREQGARSLLEDGLEKSRQGMTTLQEVLSVAHWEAPAGTRESASAPLSCFRSVARADPGRPPSTGLPRIVVAEDDPGVREAVSLTLQTLCCEVIQAVDGLDGQEKIERFLPDLAILDIQMPRMDGYELLQRIRTQLRTAFIPVILLTAKNRCEDRVKGFLLGGDDYIEKPFDHRELMARVRRQLERAAVLPRRRPGVQPGAEAC